MPTKRKGKIRTPSKGCVVTRNEEELAAALGLGPEVAAEWKFKRDLNAKIIELAQKANITHAELAEKIGTSRPKITAILNQRIADISTDLLLRVLAGLGYTLKVSIRKIA